MNALLETFFNSLDQGVVLVSPEGVARFINSAASPMLSIKPGERVRNAPLSAAIEAARHGLVCLPHRVKIAACAGFARQAVEAQLLWSPGGQHLAVVLCMEGEHPHILKASRAIGELINHQCRAPLQHFFGAAELVVELLREQRSQAPGLRPQIDRAILHGKAAVDKLSQILAIARAAEGLPIVMDERIALDELIENAANAANCAAKAKRMRFFIEGLPSDPPVIFGSRVWLERAVYELMISALECGAPGADVLITVTASQGRVGISARVAGNSAHLPQRDESFTAFYDKLQDEGLYGRALGIGLSFARWIFERHGGLLAVEDDDNGIAEFSAQLPCGLPTHTQSIDPMRQAQRYAEDLVALIRETNRLATSPDPEKSFTALVESRE